LDKAFENKGEEIMHTLADKWIDKGKKEGKTQLLSFLFEERFGNIPQ
jgi:hypothetical protein